MSEELRRLSRRDLVTGAAGALGATVLAGVALPGEAQKASVAATPPVAPPAAPPTPPPSVPPGPVRLLGAPTSPVGTRSPFERAARTPVGEVTGNSHAPLQDLAGVITPSDLHFERHHAGIPAIDPARHELLIHGLVDRPMAFTLDDIKRFPQVSRVHFLECSGNGRAAFRNPKPDMTPQLVAGLFSTSEWTGVPLSVLFREVGVKPAAQWFLAEGGDACLLTRSVPVAKAWDDAIVAWAQNGEPLRPAQGYPLRLFLPGWEGNINVKWLRRLELGTQPWMTRWETAKYTDPLLDHTARQFSLELDAKSVITSPAFPATLATGWRPITGLAWSGRGTVTRVEVSTDNGASWHDAELQGPALSRAPRRFQQMWEFTGQEAVLLSRATDETGYVQPTRTKLVAVRGIGTDYHFNQIVGCKVERDGRVFFHGAT